MKTINYILIAFILTATFSCGGNETTITKNAAPIKVTVGKVAASNTTDAITASGTIEAQKSANLSTRMMGHVTKLNAAVGQSVKKGQTLITLSSTDLAAKSAQVEAGIIQAEAAFQNAEKDYQRFKSLFEKSSASQKELDDMTTRYEMAKANLEAAKQMRKEVQAQYAYTNIAAPFDGVVVNTFVKEGDMASPGYPLVAVEGAQNFEATVMVAEADIAKIKVDAAAKVLVKSLNVTLNGTVKEVSRSAKNTGGQYLVKVSIDNLKADVLPGMFVNVSFSSLDNDANQSLSIPAEALVTQGQLKGVYAVSNNTAILRWLRIGKESNGTIEVLSGLNANEHVVIAAEGKLYNGAPIVFQQ